MAFIDQYNLAIDDVFIKRVQQAMVKSAIAVAAELPATVNHTNRASFAKEALNDPERHAVVMAFGVASNVAINAGSDDNDIEFTINAIWDAFSGVV